MARIVLLAGGFGGAKMAHGFALALGERATDLSVVVNVGDDMELHGLSISPDLDTVMYTLAGIADPDTGWGVRDETWSAAAMLALYGAPTYFRLGDRDLATHVVRTERLRAGQRLTEVTAGLCAPLGVAPSVFPMCDERVRTSIRTADGWLEFQDWFVRRRHADPALEVRFEGIDGARPTAEIRAVIAGAELIIIAPSNPFVSIGTILALPGMVQALRAASATVVAVSPIVGGAALRGPADRMFESLGGESSALGVARHYTEQYPGLLDAMVIDRIDAESAASIEALGPRVVATDTVMTDDAGRRRLAEAVLEHVRPGPGAPA